MSEFIQPSNHSALFGRVVGLQHLRNDKPGSVLSSTQTKSCWRDFSSQEFSQRLNSRSRAKVRCKIKRWMAGVHCTQLLVICRGQRGGYPACKNSGMCPRAPIQRKPTPQQQSPALLLLSAVPTLDPNPGHFLLNPFHPKSPNFFCPLTCSQRGFMDIISPV